MAVLFQFAHDSRMLVRRFGLEVAISMAALVIVAYGVSRALPSADPLRFDRGDAAWVGQLAKATADTAIPVAGPAPTSASLTVPASDVAGVAPDSASLDAASLEAASLPQPTKPAKLAALPPRRPKPADVAPAPAAPVAVATPVAATPADVFGLSQVTRHLPSREALLRPFDAVGSTVVKLFRQP